MCRGRCCLLAACSCVLQHVVACMTNEMREVVSARDVHMLGSYPGDATSASSCSDEELARRSAEGYPEIESDEELDALLEWSDGLDFDAYHADWLGLATSSRPEWSESIVPPAGLSLPGCFASTATAGGA